jgi:hypothetical protein
MKSWRHYEILETLKIDREEGTCVDLIEFELKEGLSIHDLKSIGHNEILNVLKSEGDKHTCLVRYQEPEESRAYFKEFDLDLINSTPSIISSEKFTISVIGDQKNLTSFIELVKTQVGKVLNLRFQKAAYQKHDILSVLTDKQREILIAANQYGYYDYPKKINAEQLSQKVNISKATLLQHLRKAEGRLLANILAGYSLK